MSHRPARFILALAVIAASCLAVAACGDSSDDATAKQISSVELTYAYDGLFTGPFEETFDGPAADQDVGVKLLLAGESYEDVYEQLEADAASGTLPDIAMIGLNRLRTFVETGLAQPVDDLLAEDPGFAAQTAPAFLKLTRFDGKTYGMPYAVSTAILYYNADAFKRAGLDPNNPPQTLAEVKRDARTLMDHGGVRYGVHFAWDNTGNHIFQSLVNSNGGEMADPDGTPRFNQASAVEMLEYWTDLVKSGLMPLEPYTEAEEAFVRGDIGMIVSTNSQLGTITESAKFDVRTAELPIPAGSARKTPSGGNALVILTDDPARKRAAWDAINEAVGVRGSTILTKATGYMPVNPKAAEGKELSGLFAADPNWSTSLHQIDTLVPWYNWPGTASVEITEDITDALYAAMHGDSTPQEALDQAADKVSGLVE